MLEEPVETRIEAQPEESAEQSAALARLAGAVEQLPPKLRVLVVLKDVYGLSHEEIAEELGISVAAAKVRLHRGRKRLRDVLYEESQDDARRTTMRCDDVARILPEAVDDGAAVELSRAAPHRDRACAARPSSPATAGCSGACSCCAPATSSPRPGLLAQTLAALEEAGERQAVRVDPHRAAGSRTSGAIGGAAVAAGTAAAVMIAAPLPPPRLPAAS